MTAARPQRRVALVALVVIAIAFGAAARLWLLIGNNNPTESDEAVLGLIALRATRGDFTLMYWGQTYGGPVEAYVCALLFLVTGPSVIVSKLTGFLLAAAASTLTWRVGRRIAGEHAGAVAGLLLWISPAFFVWYSTKISIYFGSLTLAVATLLCITQLRDDSVPLRRWWPPLFGIVAGLSFWASAQALFLLVPAAVVHAPDALKRWRRVLAAAPFAMLGAAPWLLFNLRNDWASLEVPPSDLAAPYSTRVAGFFPLLPMLLGVRHVGTERWVGPPVVGVVVTAVLIGLTIAVLLVRPPWWRIAAVTAGVPLAYALSPLSVRVQGGQPRYLLMMMPALVIVIAALVTFHRDSRRAAAVAVVVVAGGLTAVGLHEYDRLGYGRFAGAPDGVYVPDDFDPLLELLRIHDVEHAYADYWISFRATFEAAEETIVAPIQAHLDRYPPYTDAVERSNSPAFIALEASRVAPTLQQRLEDRDVAYQVDRRGPFVIVLPVSDVSRDDVADAYA